MTTEKLCKRCEMRPAKPSEKFCAICKRAVLGELRAALGPINGVRTFTSAGAELKGRKIRSARLAGEMPTPDPDDD